MNALILAVAIVTTPNDAQEPMPGAPPELNELSWMMGDFEFTFKASMPDGSEVDVPGTSSTKKTMGGVWLETKHSATMFGQEMTGAQLMSFDPDAKEYMSYWFDSVGPGMAEMRGKLTGQTLVLKSEMKAYPGMPGKSAYRATYSMKGRGKVLFRLETDTGAGFGVMLEGMMTRKD